MSALEQIATWIKPSPLRVAREQEANQREEKFRKVLLQAPVQSPITPIPAIPDNFEIMERNTTGGMSTKDVKDSIKVNVIPSHIQKPATHVRQTRPLHISNIKTLNEHKIVQVAPPQHGDMGIEYYLGYRRIGLQPLPVVLYSATVQHVTNINFLFPPSVIYVPERLQQEYLKAIKEVDSSAEPGIYRFDWHHEIHKIRILNEQDFSEWMKIHLHSSIDRDMVYTGA